MTDNKNKTELEIMEIINAIRNSGNTELIQIATLSYLKGLEDGVRIEQAKKLLKERILNMIKLSKNEALDYLEKGYVVIIRNKDFEDYPVIKQGEYLCRYDDPIEGELINEMLQENDEFYYDKVLDDEYYEMQVA